MFVLAALSTRVFGEAASLNGIWMQNGNLKPYH